MASPGDRAPDDRPAADLASRRSELIDLLERVAADWSVLDGLSADERRRFHRAIAAIYLPEPDVRRARIKAAERARKAAAARRDDAVLDRTGIRVGRRRPAITTPNVFPPPAFEARDLGPDQDTVDAVSTPEATGRSVTPKHCYICKQTYSRVHHFYDQLCPSCAELNYAKRDELADLRGRVALLTGGRVKIGYQAGLKLLRSGATLIVTTRFPRDSAARYSREPDFEDWADRLQIYGLDLRHTPSVEAFCRELLATRSRLDFIINNACQTVRRPSAFYAHMMAAEQAALADLPAPVAALVGTYEDLRGSRRLRGGAGQDAGTVVRAGRLSTASGLVDPAGLSQVPLLPEDFAFEPHLFPEGELDQDLQQVDLRGRNSWRLLLAEVSAAELLEVQLVNAVAPFVLNARLKSLMLRTPERDKHIVNVSAVEGQFYRTFKTTRHPHTNMAKAALNMMTRTSATEYHADGIHMNSVDTGWVTDEDPVEIAARKRSDHRFHPPLDAVDGAARILDPIISGFNTGTHVWGRFLKDFSTTDW